jgi:DNA-binding transcriptional regulator LsrR (DeoR family)
MTQEQVGDHLGVSSIHVNRVVKSLREAGIVTIRSKRVTIHNVPALTRLARPLLDIYERSRPEYSGSGNA